MKWECVPVVCAGQKSSSKKKANAFATQERFHTQHRRLILGRCCVRCPILSPQLPRRIFMMLFLLSVRTPVGHHKGLTIGTKSLGPTRVVKIYEWKKQDCSSKNVMVAVLLRKKITFSIWCFEGAFWPRWKERSPTGQLACMDLFSLGEMAHHLSSLVFFQIITCVDFVLYANIEKWISAQQWDQKTKQCVLKNKLLFAKRQRQ